MINGFDEAFELLAPPVWSKSTCSTRHAQTSSAELQSLILTRMVASIVTAHLTEQGFGVLLLSPAFGLDWVWLQRYRSSCRRSLNPKAFAVSDLLVAAQSADTSPTMSERRWSKQLQLDCRSGLHGVDWRSGANWRRAHGLRTESDTCDHSIGQHLTEQHHAAATPGRALKE